MSFCHGHESLESAKDEFQEIMPLSKLMTADAQAMVCIGRTTDVTGSKRLKVSFYCSCDVSLYGQYAKTHENKSQ